MTRVHPAKVARRLSPTQRKCILRFSDAEAWDGSGHGYAREWPDIVYGIRGAQHRSLMRMVQLEVAQKLNDGTFRLTPLGLSVQLHVRCQESANAR